MKFKRLPIGTKCFFVAHSDGMDVIHHGYKDEHVQTDSGQPHLISMNFTAFKNFLEAQNIWEGLEDEEREFYESKAEEIGDVLPQAEEVETGV